jgi:hypothetical protein
VKLASLVSTRGSYKRKTFLGVDPQWLLDPKEFVFFAKQLIYLILIFAVFITSVISDFPSAKKNLWYLIKHPFYGYDQKMKIEIGPVYDYYLFVRKNTRSDSYILKPIQQGTWPDVSNEGFTRYFLYPRKFISEERLGVDKGKVDYVFLIGNTNLYGNGKIERWPDFDVPAKSIVLYSQETGQKFKEIKMDYNYEKFLDDDFEYSKYWGIIEVDKTRKW